MAENKQTPALFMVALFLLSGATPLAHGQLLSGGIVNGALCCTSSGACTPGAAPIPGAVVSLNCSTIFGTVVTLAQGVTNSTGIFSVRFINLLGLLGPLLSRTLPCGLLINVPLNPTVCPLLNGTISAVPVLVNTVGNALTGLTGIFSANVTVGR